MSVHHDAVPPVAILLINLGTPDAPTPTAVRRYLAEFLSDPRVVELPAWLWQILLRLFILPLRSRLAAARYAAIWSKQGAPLRIHTQAQTERLREWLHDKGYPVVLEYAMRYGTPGIATVLDRLVQEGAERVLIVPLYPQYSAASTASAFDAVYATLKRLRNQPALRTIKHYADDDGYIDAMAGHIRRYWEDHGTPDFAAADRLILSFHGLPARASERGDPYQAQCQKTAALLSQALGLSGDACQLTFQSRFGPQQWLQPYTTTILKKLGTAGVRRVDVFCPGFTADCLETLEEIGIAGRTAFLAAGGHEYHALPCLNASADWIESLGQLVARNLQGWVKPYT